MKYLIYHQAAYINKFKYFNTDFFNIQKHIIYIYSLLIKLKSFYQLEKIKKRKMKMILK